ncbi:MAG: hypothetical protein K0S76_2576 [Herbinix sp.]|jgi:ferredoxin|nr:hypothetical protein [Herbinix sp.]
MKVGVITFHSANNYGATLQTWALQKVLKDYGLDSGVIHYHPDIIDKLYDPMQLQTGIRRKIKNLAISVTNNESLIRYQKFQNFLSKNFNLIGDYRTYPELKQAGLDLDAYIVGSDQVWNVDHTDGFDPAYFLDFAEKDKIKISYAASIGKDYIHSKIKQEVRNSLTSYTGISVRERSVLEAVQELTDKTVEVVLDPTLLLKKADYEEIKTETMIREPYILVYMIEKNDQVISLANKISIALGIPVIQRRPTPGFVNELPPFYTADTGEFLGLIESATCVITNSFHGTVFSILYEKPFVSMLHSDTGSRTVDLLNELNLQSHILYDIKDFKDFNMFQIEDLKELHKRIEKLQKASNEFLLRSLKIVDKYDRVQCPTNIKKENCYGCTACQSVCKVKAIRMEEDKEGFLYPIVDESKCVSCGLCKKVCIRRHLKTVEFKAHYPKAYYAYHLDQEERNQSSSGAIYPALAKYVIEEKQGVVVGVRYDEDMKVISDIADNLEDARAFCGTKYVKSDFNGIFPRIRKLLKEGRFVLYTGLPCECAGLRSFLRKDYENLLICELVCRAVPSPKVFRQYVDYLNKKYRSKVVNIVFTDKKKGWKYSDANMVITTQNGNVHADRSVEDVYFKAFLNDYIIRPVCSKCRYTFKHRIGDITLGDCWGIQNKAPELFDNKGVSMVLANNPKGKEVWDIISSQFKFKEGTLKSVYYKNHKKPSKEKRQRTAFFNKLDREPIENLLNKYYK